jgi:hypothetical protein
MNERGNPIDNPEDFPEYFPQYAPFIIIPKGLNLKVTHIGGGVNIIEGNPQDLRWWRYGE